MSTTRKLIPLDEEMQKDIAAVQARLTAQRGEKTSFCAAVRILLRLGLGRAKELAEAAEQEKGKKKEEAAP